MDSSGSPTTSQNNIIFHCHVCFAVVRSHTAPDGKFPEFVYTSCGHTLCASHLFPDEVPVDALRTLHVCPHCGSNGVSIEGEPPADMLHFFAPAEELFKALRFQHESLLGVAHHHKSRSDGLTTVLDQNKNSMLRARDELVKNRKQITEQQAEIANLREENEALRSQLSSAQARDPVMDEIQRSIGDFASAAIPAKRKAGSPEDNGRRVSEFRPTKPLGLENKAAIPLPSGRGQYSSPGGQQRPPGEEFVNDGQRPRELPWQENSHQERDPNQGESLYQRYMEERLQQHYSDPTQRPPAPPPQTPQPQPRPPHTAQGINRPFLPPGRAQAPPTPSRNTMPPPHRTGPLLDITTPRPLGMAPPTWRNGYPAPAGNMDQIRGMIPQRSPLLGRRSSTVTSAMNHGYPAPESMSPRRDMNSNRLPTFSQGGIAPPDRPEPAGAGGPRRYVNQNRSPTVSRGMPPPASSHGYPVRPELRREVPSNHPSQGGMGAPPEPDDDCPTTPRGMRPGRNNLGHNNMLPPDQRNAPFGNVRDRRATANMTSPHFERGLEAGDQGHYRNFSFPPPRPGATLSDLGALLEKGQSEFVERPPGMYPRVDRRP